MLHFRTVFDAAPKGEGLRGPLLRELPPRGGRAAERREEKQVRVQGRRERTEPGKDRLRQACAEPVPRQAERDQENARERVALCAEEAERANGEECGREDVKEREERGDDAAGKVPVPPKAAAGGCPPGGRRRGSGRLSPRP